MKHTSNALRPRKGRIIYYNGNPVWPWPGSATVSEWLYHWTWMYFINEITAEELEERFDYITPDMPGALDQAEWDRNVAYIQLVTPE